VWVCAFAGALHAELKCLAPTQGLNKKTKNDNIIVTEELSLLLGGTLILVSLLCGIQIATRCFQKTSMGKFRPHRSKLYWRRVCFPNKDVPLEAEGWILEVWLPSMLQPTRGRWSSRSLVRSCPAVQRAPPLPRSHKLHQCSARVEMYSES